LGWGLLLKGDDAANEYFPWEKNKVTALIIQQIFIGSLLFAKKCSKS
jgi:hypothetical protein